MATIQALKLQVLRARLFSITLFAETLPKKIYCMKHLERASLIFNLISRVYLDAIICSRGSSSRH